MDTQHRGFPIRECACGGQYVDTPNGGGWTRHLSNPGHIAHEARFEAAAQVPINEPAVFRGYPEVKPRDTVGATCDHLNGDTTWCRQHGSPWPDQTDSPRCAVALVEALGEKDEALGHAIYLLAQPLTTPATRAAMAADEFVVEMALLRLMQLGEASLKAHAHQCPDGCPAAYHGYFHEEHGDWCNQPHPCPFDTVEFPL